MRKDLILPALALAGGAGGFFLRRRHWAGAYQPELGLFASGAPSLWALLGLAALLALAFLLLTRAKEGPEDFLPAFGNPGAGQMAVFAAAWLLLMFAGAAGVVDGIRGLRLWRSAPEMYQMSVPAARMLSGGLCALAGFSILFMGRMAYRGELNDAACRLAPLPALAGVVWLFSAHLQSGIEPELLKYGFQLAAICLLTLAHYYTAGFLFGRACRQRAMFFSLLGGALGLLSLADRPDLFTASALLAYSLSALNFAKALLRSTFGPPWPKRLEGRMPPAEEEHADGT